MEIILTKDAFNRYKDEAIFKKSGTRKNYVPKIEKFSKKYDNANVVEALSPHNIEQFILSYSLKNLPLSALEHFYNFVYSYVVQDTTYHPFPIDKSKYQDEISESNVEESAGWLTSDFDYYQLFENKWYDHLNNDRLKITLKACLAVCLGAAYDTSEIEGPTGLTIDHFKKCDQTTIKVKNIYDNYGSRWIYYNNFLSEIINEYIELRANLSKDTDLFFVRLWSRKEARNIKCDENIWGNQRNPTRIKEWVSYLFKYMHRNFDNFPDVGITHLKEYTVFQYLKATNGQGLQNIIRTYKWQSFVAKSFERFIQESALPEPNVSIVFDKDKLNLMGEDHFFLFPHQK